MFDDTNQDPSERTFDAATMAREKADEFRMHAELAAVFEGVRKFEARLVPGFDSDLMRQVQRGVAKLERARLPDSPLVPEPSAPEAAALLGLPETQHFSTNDYHIHRRPGEVMIARWLAGDEVDLFYERLQAHFDAALNGYRQEERSSKEWKQDPQTIAYLDALDAIDVKLAERFHRALIREHNLFVLSTQSADELNIAYLSDFIMGVSAAQIVGEASAPSDEPTESELAWFFKLFLLRGVRDSVEQMCFFAYLQKSDDTFDVDE